MTSNTLLLIRSDTNPILIREDDGKDCREYDQRRRVELAGRSRFAPLLLLGCEGLELRLR